MIHPANESEASSFRDVCYQIVAWDDHLPAFDPLPMTKTVLLRPDSVKLYNRIVVQIKPLLRPCVFTGLAIRFAVFAVPARVGRILAPISVILHMFGMVTTAAQLRTEYVNIILHTFDFWFLQAANTVWVIFFSVVLKDIRIVLVIFCWADFAFWLLQETYLRNSYSVVFVALWEWLFYVMLMAALSLDLVDEVHHYSLLSAGDRTLSTKDVLLNTIGTMAMLSLRNLYRRYKHVKHQRNKPGTATPALGYRSKISLRPSGPLITSIQPVTRPQPDRKPLHETGQNTAVKLSSKRPPLQMYLAADLARFDPRGTVWPRIGALSRIATWKIVAMYLCGATGGIFAVLSLFLPTNIYGGEVIAIAGLVASTFFSGVFACCCQRGLLKRVMSSFHFHFLWLQILTIGLCVVDLFSWRWVPTCGVASGLVLAYAILTVDALTPIMKRRLRFTYWIMINGIVLFMVVQILVLLDVLVLGNWDLQDRVFLDCRAFNHRAQFRVAPFLFSRVFTVCIWSGRYVYVALARPDDNALILLRWNIEFDYEGWKKQINLEPRS